jgi:hypothetical protein
MKENLNSCNLAQKMAFYTAYKNQFSGCLFVSQWLSFRLCPFGLNMLNDTTPRFARNDLREI